MTTEFELAVIVVLSFLSAMLLGKPAVKLMTRLKGSQPILNYVEQHKEKAGTPTMGGVIFLVPTAVFAAVFADKRLSMWAAGVTIILCYGVIGFLDDFIKVRYRKNEGLKPYQKIIPQLLIAGFGTYYLITNRFIGTEVFIPFAGYVDFGYWYIPLAVTVFVAMSNAVNLTDGLDGLAGWTSLVYVGTFVLLGLGVYTAANGSGKTLYAAELSSFLAVFAALAGALLAFLWFNSEKASIYMGDTGSLALGGAAAVAVLFLKTPFMALFAGIMFVVSCISVIVQVGYFKATKKRVFLMAPFHHHLELKGYKESKIVSYYVIATAIGSVFTLILSNV